MRLRPVRLALALALLLSSTAPGGLAAQENATLIADKLEIAGDNRLVADGAVEVFYQGRRLTASRIVYDQSADRLSIEGPIRLTDEAGTTVIVGAQADLSADLTEGILQSARVVLDEQLQMSAAEMRRSEGRYLQLDNAVASSCRICAGSSTPLWEIRARRILHDQEERQIYFDDAQLRFGGTPVLFIPRLRIPDPTLDRSDGFLMPTFTTRTGLGFGVTMPYFLTLGPSRDLTFSPTLTTKGGRSLGLRYRQVFETGAMVINGALSQDHIQPGQMRGYVMADGTFAMPRDFRLSFHGEAVSDDAYLADYDISDQDRLTNSVLIERVRRKDYLAARIINFQTLRENDLPSATPYLLTDATYLRRVQFGQLGGEGTLRFGTHTHTRQASDATDSDNDPDNIAEGADLSRISLGVDWRRDWVAPGGVLAAVLGDLRIDGYRVTDDQVYAGNTTRTLAAGAVELRWPWVRTEAGGRSQVIEPIAQFVWSSDADGKIPNEDSRLAEFDEANLFSLNRFPGADAVETGFRANLGIGWTRIDPSGWTLGVTLGRVFRDDPTTSFSTASGLGGRSSDWMFAVTAESATGLALAGRVITGSDLSAARSEVHVDYSANRFSVNSGYIWSIADKTEGRNAQVSDFVLGGSYQINPWWSATASGRYDFEGDSYRTADFGLAYRNECLNIDLSLSRRFTTSTTVSPGTTVDFSVKLVGFGTGTAAGPNRMCRR